MIKKANSFAKKVLYQLKKGYGQPVDLYLRGTVTQNDDTGKQVVPETKWKLKKIPVLQTTAGKMDNLAQNFAVAGRPFEFGGFYSVNETHVLVPYKDLPEGYTLNKTDAFIINHRRFEILGYSEINDVQMVDFNVRELVGQPVNELTDDDKEILDVLETFQTDEIDFTIIQDVLLNIPHNKRFYPNRVEVICRAKGGTIVTQPIVRAGILGDLDKYYQAITTLITAQYKREVITSLTANEGETDFRLGIATPASVSAGGYLRGYLLVQGELVD